MSFQWQVNQTTIFAKMTIICWLGDLKWNKFYLIQIWIKKSNLIIYLQNLPDPCMYHEMYWFSALLKMIARLSDIFSPIVPIDNAIWSDTVFDVSANWILDSSSLFKIIFKKITNTHKLNQTIFFDIIKFN